MNTVILSAFLGGGEKTRAREVHVAGGHPGASSAKKKKKQASGLYGEKKKENRWDAL